MPSGRKKRGARRPRKARLTVERRLLDYSFEQSLQELFDKAGEDLELGFEEMRQVTERQVYYRTRPPHPGYN